MTEKEFPKYDETKRLYAAPCICCDTPIYFYLTSVEELKNLPPMVCGREKPSCVNKFKEKVTPPRPSIHVVGLNSVDGNNPKKATKIKKKPEKIDFFKETPSAKDIGGNQVEMSTPIGLNE